MNFCIKRSLVGFSIQELNGYIMVIGTHVTITQWVYERLTRPHLCQTHLSKHIHATIPFPHSMTNYAFQSLSSHYLIYTTLLLYA